MQIQREKLVAMFGLINRLLSQKTSVKFHYLLLKNKKILQTEVDALQEAQQAEPPEGHEEFNTKRMDLCKEYCEKDENDEPKITNGNFVIPEDRKEEFEKNMDALKEEYKEVMEVMDKRQEDFLNLLKEDVDVDLTIIPLSVMPQDLVGNEVEVLFDIIDGDK
jgi:hypothetical protein